MSDIAHGVLMANSDVMNRRALPMWTIYNRPKDFPDGYIARMHEVGGDRAGPSPIVLTLELHELREVFRDAGLICIARHESDDPKIVETWV